MEVLQVEEQLEVNWDLEEWDGEQRIHEEQVVDSEMQEQLAPVQEEVHYLASCKIKSSPCRQHQCMLFLQVQSHQELSPCDCSFFQHQEQCWN